MTGLEALDNLIATLRELPKIAPPAELPGLAAALEAARAARTDVDEEDMQDKTTLAMWKAGADFFSSKYSPAERCQMARDCYEAMTRARPKDQRPPKPWHYPSADESKRA